MNISAVVMASGLSKRMNGDKLHMKINNRMIFEYILETLKECKFYEVIVVAKDSDILEHAECLGFKAVENINSYLGQSVSIKLGLNNAITADGYMFFVADQPFIKAGTIDMLCKEFDDNPDKIIIPNHNGNNCNPVIFPYCLKEQLMGITGDSGGKVIINKNLDKVVKVTIRTHDEFIDIDTMEDYRRVGNMKVIE